jgi:adenosylcobinamide amidohydrolase
MVGWRVPFLPPRLDGPFLIVPLGEVHRTLSWAVTGGGFHRAATVVWRQVAERELSPGDDPRRLLPEDAVGMLTGRDVSRFEQAANETVRVVATVGLGNALAAGDPPGPLTPGTINVLVQMAGPLSDAALVEAISIATEARTQAVLAARVRSRRSSRWASGTGTDCIVVASPQGKVDGDGGEPWAGKHTLVGARIGAAVGDAVARGVRAWIAEQ